MATSVIFGNKKITLPGTYGEIVSGIKNAPQNLSYGNIIIIDTGSGSGMIGGAGVAGTLKSGKDSIYFVDDIKQYRNHIRNGIWWKLGEPLYRPNGPGTPGVSRAWVIKAAQTVPAEISYTFTGGGSGGGNVIAQVRDEGLVGNGTTNNTAAVAIGVLTGVPAIGDVINVFVDDGTGPVLIGTFTTISNVLSAARTGINAAINVLVDDYSSTIVGSYLHVAASLADGAAANDYVISFTIVPAGGSTLAGSWGSFLGGQDADNLQTGYGARISAGVVDPLKFIVKWYRSTFRGYDADNQPYDGILPGDHVSQLLATSPEFATIVELTTWMKNDGIFNKYFALKAGATANGTGALDAGDITANAGWNLAAGGTETYSSTYLDEVLEAIPFLDYTFVLADRWANDAQDAENIRILGHLVDEARYDKFIVIGGGNDISNFDQSPNGSIPIAQFYNNDHVVVIHGGPKKTSNIAPTGFKNFESIYKAAVVLGRTCGLQPQIPLTFKRIDIEGEQHNMNPTEQGLALAAGVLYTGYDDELTDFVVFQGVNTLQNNENQINEDGTSFSLQIRRIAAQINKEIIVNSKKELMASEQGPNQHTLNEADVKVWVQSFLKRKTTKTNEDNLITGFESVTVTREEDNLFITYGFFPNGEINKLFFTGVMLDSNL